MVKQVFQIKRNENGFTLIEIVIVVTLLTIMAMMVAPKIGAMLGGGKGDMIALRSIIAKTFDDAYLHNRMNMLAVHCKTPLTKDSQATEPWMSRENGVSVLTLNDQGNFEDSKVRVLAYKKFSPSFNIEAVTLSNGEKITAGTVLIPFYPEGLADDSIIHITSGDNRKSVILFKLRKEPRETDDFIDFETVRSGNYL